LARCSKIWSHWEYNIYREWAGSSFVINKVDHSAQLKFPVIWYLINETRTGLYYNMEYGGHGLFFFFGICSTLSILSYKGVFSAS
jgi:hypothetical protein